MRKTQTNPGLREELRLSGLVMVLPLPPALCVPAVSPYLMMLSSICMRDVAVNNLLRSPSSILVELPNKLPLSHTHTQKNTETHEMLRHHAGTHVISQCAVQHRIVTALCLNPLSGPAPGTSFLITCRFALPQHGASTCEC